MKTLLTADIGGTHSRFGIFHAGRNGRLSLINIHWLNTPDYGSFAGLIEGLRASDFQIKPEDADMVVIAIAGPVESGRSSPPFISWDIDISNAEKDLGFKRSALINDFVAQAFACLSPAGESAEQVLSGERTPGAAIAVVGAGTDFGKAALIPDGKGGYRAAPSEGGHANFPFVSRRECEFQAFLLGETSQRYITIGDVVSGRGLSFLHRFLTGDKLEPQEVTERFREYPETLEWASRFYARACRNYALETLAAGGLYIAGGVAAKNPALVTGTVFEAEFRSSDTMEELLRKIPVSLVKDENSGLWGAAVFGLQKLSVR